ncbi:MAG: TonB-dependent receptor [Paraglaciecola sp.]|nr:TonB-dependent receptor [Paraglaciecola sp.]
MKSMKISNVAIYLAVLSALNPLAAIADEVEKISITGSHIKRADYEGSSPVTVFDREMIEKTGSLNMIDVANSLTMNSGSRFTNESVNLAGTSQFNIRGLGPGSTLTLINGRRAGIAPSSTNLGNQFFDINQLPLAMIKRIDFLTDGASSTYGSQAVAGVANIITRKGFEGLEISGRGLESSNSAFDVNLVAGAKSNKGTFNIYATLSGQSINYRSDFDFINERAGGNGDPYASKFLSSTGSPGTYSLANIDAQTGAITATGATTLDPDCEGAGGFIKGGLCRLNLMDQLSVIPKENRFQVFTEFDYDLTDNITAYGEFSFSRNKVQAILGAPFYSNGLVEGGSMFVPGDHPFNFFVANENHDGLVYIGPENWDNSIHQGVDLVAKARPFGVTTNGDSSSGINNHYDIEFNYHHAVMGLEIELSDDWSLDTSYVYSVGTKTDTTQLGLSKTTFNDSVLNGIFNPFGTSHTSPNLVSPKDGTSLAGNSDEELSTIIHALVSETYSEQQVVEAIFSGDLFEIDAGVVAVAIGAQHRYENYTYTPDSLSAKGLGFGSTPASSIAGETKVNALFAELFVPVSDDIELQAALRYEDYDTAGSTLDPKVSLSWSISEELTLRSSFGTSFQAPTNLQTGLTSGAQFLSDPVTYENGVGKCKNTGISNLVFINTQGSDQLSPSKAKNWNLGLIYQPTSNFMVKGDLWSFNYDDLVAQDSSASGVVNNQCAGVEEGGAPKADSRILRSPEGQLREITLNYINTGAVETSGLDISFNYDIELDNMGDIALGLNNTYVAKFDITAIDGGETVDGAGNYNSSNAFKAMPKLRSNFHAAWTFNRHLINASVRYISSYKNDQTADEGDKIGAFTTLNLKYSYDFNVSELGSTTLSVGANNVLDTAPPTLGHEVRPGYDATTHDVRGRIVFAAFKHSF